MSPNEIDLGAQEELTQDQKDIIGEISNISMGAAATALSNIIGKKVTITSPNVELATMESIDGIQRTPSVGVIISYTEGVVGKDILIIKQADATKIVNVLMGGMMPEDAEFDELHLSAMAEVMNQMMGSAATALSDFIGRSVNISPPNAFILTDDNKAEKLSFIYDQLNGIVLVRFIFSVEDMFESDIYMIMTHEFTDELIRIMLQNMGIADMTEVGEEMRTVQSPQVSAPPVAPMPTPEPVTSPVMPAQPVYPDVEPQMAPAQPMQPPYPQNPVVYGQDVRQEQAAAMRAPVMQTAIRPAVLPSFDPADNLTPDEAANFELIQEVPLELSVEVGRARKLVKEVIDFSVGTIVELDKQAGDPVDIIANGQLIARGEVVVIDESFGVRVTEIINKKSKGRA